MGLVCVNSFGLVCIGWTDAFILVLNLDSHPIDHTKPIEGYPTSNALHPRHRTSRYLGDTSSSTSPIAQRNSFSPELLASS